MKRVVFLHGILPDSLPWRVCVKGILRLSPFWGYRMTGDDVKFTVCIPTLLSRLDCVFLYDTSPKASKSPHQPFPKSKILNIVSKFTFIIWMQRMKMVHQRKLEAARELYGLSPTDDVAEDELKAKATTGKARRCGWGCLEGEVFWDP